MGTIRSKLILILIITGLAASLPVVAEVTSASGNADIQEERWTINLKSAGIRDFINQIADITGQTFIIDPRVSGEVSVISNSPLALDEVYKLFLSVMATHEYSVLTQDGQARIVPNANAKTETDSGRPAAYRLETRLIQVHHVPVADLIPLISPLVPQYGHLAAVTSSNALIISDRSANITRLENLIHQLDQNGTHDYSVVTLQHAWVMDAAEVLNASVTRGQAKVGSSTQVIADTRTNRLIIIGPPEARKKLTNLAQSLDSPTSLSINTRVIRLRHNNAKYLAQTLSELSEGLKDQQVVRSGGKPSNILIRADESLNALILLAEPEMVASLEDIVRQLDIPRAQVMVEAAIVEVSGDITEALGVQWAIDGRSGSGIDGISGVNFGSTGLSIGSVIEARPSNLPDGAIIGIGSDNFGALITALSANNKSNLLSTPSLLTLDNQKAEILVGQNVPFQTGSFTTSAAGADNPFTTIERKDIGVNLKITPSINEGATLRLEIEQEISSIAPSTSLNAQAVDLVTNKRMIKSTILAGDGQVVVLGGLIQDDVTNSTSKVPFLGDVPLLGRLFRSTRETHIKRNLMIFLRPTVVRDITGLRALSGKRYSDIQILDFGNDEQSSEDMPLNQLFDAPKTIDLRRVQ